LAALGQRALTSVPSNEFARSLSEKRAEYVRACFIGLWIKSVEHDRALSEISRLCQDRAWLQVVCDIVPQERLQELKIDVIRVGGPFV
jgi:hypothetical protein